jgi:hypothetical protein
MTNQFSYQKDSGSQYWHLWIEGKPRVKVLTGQPVNLRNGETRFNTCAPTKELYELMPNNWDKENEAINLIDEVVVYSKGAIIHD